MLQLKSNHSAT